MKTPISIGAVIVACVALTGCPTETPLDTNGDDTACDNELQERFPAPDATDAYYRTTIEAKFKEIDEFDLEDGSATLTVTQGSTEIAGEYAWNVEGERLIFTPSSPLAPATTYTVTAHYSCGDPTWSFTTSEVGASVDALSLEGRSYILDLSSGRFVEPEGIGAILGDQLEQDILIGVDGVDLEAEKIAMVGALGYTAAGSSVVLQDACEEAIDFSAQETGPADFSGNPYFSVGPQDTTLDVAGYSIDVQDLHISGAFSPTGDYISGATLGGSIDTMPLASLTNEDCSIPDKVECDENAICALAVGIGVECEFCPGANEDLDYCGHVQDDPETTDVNEWDTAPVGGKCCLSLLVDSMVAVERLTDEEEAWPVEVYTTPGEGGENDPCITNAEQCNNPPDQVDPECAAG